jgi:hypothetical protein
MDALLMATGVTAKDGAGTSNSKVHKSRFI